MKSKRFGEFIVEYSLILNDFLEQALTVRVDNEKLREILQYSVLAPGKRLRPLLFLGTMVELGQKINPEHIKIAGGLEIIHTYSLIHDDLPSMDDDDYRRGQLTSHKKFGEANAILAGDALLTLGINWVLAAQLDEKDVVGAARLLTDAIGPNGMVGGQFLDIQATNSVVTEEEVSELEYKKTAELIVAAVKMGTIFGKATPKQTDALIKFATDFGRAFQIYDDLIDVTESTEEAGKATEKDIVAGKNNYVTRFGIDGAKNKLQELIEQMKEDLVIFDSDVLIGLTSVFMKVLEDDQKES